MSLDSQKLRAIRHHPALGRFKTVARVEFAQPGWLKRCLAADRAAYNGGITRCVGNSALLAEVNRAYGMSIAVSLQPVELSSAAN